MLLRRAPLPLSATQRGKGWREGDTHSIEQSFHAAKIDSYRFIPMEIFVSSFYENFWNPVWLLTPRISISTTLRTRQRIRYSREYRNIRFIGCFITRLRDFFFFFVCEVSFISTTFHPYVIFNDLYREIFIPTERNSILSKTTFLRFIHAKLFSPRTKFSLLFRELSFRESLKARGHDNVFLFIYLFVRSQKSIAIFPPISVSYWDTRY